jgi:hypothetical protein
MTQHGGDHDTSFQIPDSKFSSTKKKMMVWKLLFDYKEYMTNSASWHYVRSTYHTSDTASHEEWWTGKDWTHHETRRVPFPSVEAEEIAQRLVLSTSAKRSHIGTIPA